MKRNFVCLAIALLAITGCQAPQTPPSPTASPTAPSGRTTPRPTATPSTYWPEDAKYMDTFVDRNRRALPRFQEVAKTAKDARVRKLAAAQADALGRQVRLFQTWRKRWYERLPPFTNFTEATGAEAMVLPSSAMNDKDWLENLLVFQRNTLHMTRHFQNRILSRPELQRFAMNAANRLETEIDETRALLDKL